MDSIGQRAGRGRRYPQRYWLSLSIEIVVNESRREAQLAI